MPRENDPIIGTFPDEKQIKCKDCKFRDKKLVLGKDKGAAKCWCDIYTEQEGVPKPVAILFKNADCRFYEKED